MYSLQLEFLEDAILARIGNALGNYVKYERP